jgi:hypothetical protein
MFKDNRSELSFKSDFCLSYFKQIQTANKKQIKRENHEYNTKTANKTANKLLINSK